MSLTGSASEVTNLDALCGKISRVSPHSIDASLSQEGAAAEAKATGAAIANAKAGIDGHLQSKANPHGVTKAQIGLDNVDNTADVEKPVSVPQKEALDKKVDKETNKGLSTNDFTNEYREKLDGIEAGANKFTYTLNDGDVTTPKVADKAITVAKLADDAKSKGVAVVLTAAGWASNSQTVNVEGVTAGNNVLVAAAPASRTAWNDAEVYCSGQGEGTLTFACSSTPTADVTANVVILV